MPHRKRLCPACGAELEQKLKQCAISEAEPFLPDTFYVPLLLPPVREGGVLQRFFSPRASLPAG